MFSIAYPASFRADGRGCYLVSFPDFPNAHTDGKNLADAVDEGADCLGSTIAERIAERLEIPRPSAVKRGQKLLPVPLWIAGKLALYLAMREQRVSNSELARRLGVRETVVRRMLDPDHATKTEKLEAALRALGKRIVVGVVSHAA